MPEKRLDGGIRRRKVTIQHHDLEVPAKFWKQNPHGPFVLFQPETINYY